MHDGMQYDPIQGQGHEPLKVGNSAIFKGYIFIFIHHNGRNTNKQERKNNNLTKKKKVNNMPIHWPTYHCSIIGNRQE